MADTVYLAGAAANILETAETFTATSADTNFGTEFLADGDPGTVFKFSTAAADDGIVADLNQLLNGGFESGFVSGVPNNWVDRSTGDGVLSEETTIVDEGSSSLKLSAGASGEAIATQDIDVVAGTGMTITAALRGGVGTTRIRVYNLDTGKWLGAGEAWGATTGDWFNRNVTSWSTDGPSTFTVEAASVGKRAIYRLRIEVRNHTTNGIGYVDDFAIWPHWDFAALFGAEYPPSVTARIRSDDNVSMSSATNQVAFTLGKPGIYGEPASTVTERYAQLYFDTVAATRPNEVGEWVLGTKQTLPNQVRIEWEAAINTAVVGSQDRGGRTTPVSLERDASREFTLRCFATTDAQLVTLREKLFDAVSWGGGRLIIVPDDTKADIFYGWLGAPVERKNQTMWDIEAPFTGAGFAVRVK